jgi:hypothetical protein
MGYPKAIYITLITMGVYYVENVCLWFKSALYDAPYRLILDVQLEKQKLDREQFLSEKKIPKNQDECATTSPLSPTISE